MCSSVCLAPTRQCPQKQEVECWWKRAVFCSITPGPHPQSIHQDGLLVEKPPLRSLASCLRVQSCRSREHKQLLGAFCFLTAVQTHNPPIHQRLTLLVHVDFRPVETNLRQDAVAQEARDRQVLKGVFETVLHNCAPHERRCAPR